MKKYCKINKKLIEPILKTSYVIVDVKLQKTH